MKFLWVSLVLATFCVAHCQDSAEAFLRRMDEINRAKTYLKSYSGVQAEQRALINSRSSAKVRMGSGLSISNQTDVESNAAMKQKLLQQMSALLDQELKAKSRQVIRINSADYQGVELVIVVDDKIVFHKR